MSEGEKKKKGEYPIFQSSHKAGTPYKKGKTLLLHRESILMISAVIAALIIITVLFILMWSSLKPFFIWLVALIIIVFTRRTDLWYMGIEVHFLVAFMFSYVFGIWYTIPLIAISLGIVFKLRPDQGSGLVIQITTLTFIAALARIIFYFYGVGITEAELVFAYMICIILAQIADTILSIFFCPAPKMKIAIIHTFGVLVNYYIIQFLGWSILIFLRSSL